MDNLTHSLAGWALGQTGLKTKSRKGLAALILGANMPDIDVFTGSFPWEPLAMHRGFTHGLVGGILLMPPLLAGLLWLLDRWQVKRGARFRSGLAMNFRWLLALSFLGAVTHPLLDGLTTYSVQLMSPFSEEWYHFDGLFIIDAFLWTILPLSIAWSRMREAQGREWRRVPQAAVAASIVYIALNMGISQHAKSTLLARLAGSPPSALYASPEPVRFWRRDLYWRQGRWIGRVHYDPLRGGLVSMNPPVRDNLDDRIVQQALSDPAIRSFIRWSTMTTATVERNGCDATVTFGDARYGDTTARSSFLRQSRVKLCR